MDPQTPESPTLTSAPADGATAVFRLMDLPAELREEIYYHASPSFPPLETDKPDLARVPAIAQLSRLTRKEALAVFYRNRDIHIRLQSDRDIINTNGWMDSCAKNAELSNKIVIKARFDITISCSKKEPQFTVKVQPSAESQSRASSSSSSSYMRVRRRPGSGSGGAYLLHHEVSEYLCNKAASRPEDRRGKLTVGEMRSIINIVRKITGCA